MSDQNQGYRAAVRFTHLDHPINVLCESLHCSFRRGHQRLFISQKDAILKLRQRPDLIAEDTVRASISPHHRSALFGERHEMLVRPCCTPVQNPECSRVCLVTLNYQRHELWRIRGKQPEQKPITCSSWWKCLSTGRSRQAGATTKSRGFCKGPL